MFGMFATLILLKCICNCRQQIMRELCNSFSKCVFCSPQNKMCARRKSYHDRMIEIKSNIFLQSLAKTCPEPSLRSKYRPNVVTTLDLLCTKRSKCNWHFLSPLRFLFQKQFQQATTANQMSQTLLRQSCLHCLLGFTSMNASHVPISLQQKSKRWSTLVDQLKAMCQHGLLKHVLRLDRARRW